MKIFKLLFISIILLFSFPAFSVTFKALVVTLDDSSEVLVPIYGDVVLTTDEENNLLAQGIYADYTLPLAGIKGFEFGETEIPEEPDDAGIDTSIIGSDTIGTWTIYDSRGVLMSKGSGIPDLTTLPKGKIYIVSQENFKYKVLVR